MRVQESGSGLENGMQAPGLATLAYRVWFIEPRPFPSEHQCPLVRHVNCCADVFSIFSISLPALGE